LAIGRCCGCRGCCWSPRWPCRPCSRWRSHRPPLVGYLTAGATPVWLLGSFAVLTLLYRAPDGATPQATSARVGANASGGGPDQLPSGAGAQSTSAGVLTKRAQAERIFADLSADGAPPSSAQLAQAVGLSASYARALVAEFHARPPVASHGNGRLSASLASAAVDPEQER
jgi:hypothetical protein